MVPSPHIAPLEFGQDHVPAVDVVENCRKLHRQVFPVAVTSAMVTVHDKQSNPVNETVLSLAAANIDQT